MTEKQNEYALAVREERDPVLYPTWERMKDQAIVLHKSSFFPKSIRSPEQALAIMLAGRELDLGPMESLRSIYIVDGQTTISSGLMAAMIWQAGHSYTIDKSTDTECQITFTRSSGQTYTHRFTHEDAKKAGLLGKGNWDKYEKAMLFNRCISAGARAIMPDVFRKLYTPEEMGAPVTVSESGDVVIDAEYQTVEPKQEAEPQQETGNGHAPDFPAERPWTPEKVRELLTYYADTKRAKGMTGDPTPAMIGLAAGKLNECFAGQQNSDNMRRDVLYYLFGVESSKGLDKAQVAAILNWIADDKDPATNDYPLKEHARAEANAIFMAQMNAAGQQELL